MIYAAEYLNPQLCLTLNDEQITLVQQFIADEASSWGSPIPTTYEQMQNRNDDRIACFTDDQRLRKLGRDQDLLSF